MKKKNSKCEWTRDKYEGDFWLTSCGKEHFLNDGMTLKENEMKYCCYCGKEIKEKGKQ